MVKKNLQEIYDKSEASEPESRTLQLMYYDIPIFVCGASGQLTNWKYFN